MDSKVFKWWGWVLSYSLSWVFVYMLYVLLTSRKGDDIESAYGYFRNVLIPENSTAIIIASIFLSSFISVYYIFILSDVSDRIFKHVHRYLNIKSNHFAATLLSRAASLFASIFYMLSIYIFVFLILFYIFLAIFPFLSFFAFYGARTIFLPFFRLYWQISVSFHAWMYMSSDRKDSFFLIFLEIFAADVAGLLVAWIAASIYMGMLDIDHVGWRSHVAYSVALFAGGIFGGVLSGWSLARALLPESSLQRILPFNAEGLRNSVVIPLVFHVGVVVMLAIVVRKLGW